MKFSIGATAVLLGLASALPAVITDGITPRSDLFLEDRAASKSLPKKKGTKKSSSAIKVKGTFDGGMYEYNRNSNICKEQEEGGEKDAMFILEKGATLKNVIIGKNQAEGVHCKGTCTLQNVWWVDVCEDAATFKQSSGTSKVKGGGAFKAADKIFQFNGFGKLQVSDFYAKDYGKVVRSCGNCKNNGKARHIEMSGIIAEGKGPLCGINKKYGDTCTIKNSCGPKSCEVYQGNNKGSSTKKLSTGHDGKNCKASGFKKC